jgi:hypothetical protein
MQNIHWAGLGSKLQAHQATARTQLLVPSYGILSSKMCLVGKREEILLQVLDFKLQASCANVRSPKVYPQAESSMLHATIWNLATNGIRILGKDPIPNLLLTRKASAYGQDVESRMFMAATIHTSGDHLFHI